MPRSPLLPTTTAVAPPSSVLAGRVGDVTTKSGRRAGPVWAGPQDPGRQGGVTQSLISRWLVCRERFRLYVVEGLRASERWPHRLGYGNMWHVCEEALAAKRDWVDALRQHLGKELNDNPMDRDAIEHWYCVCRTQFPIYVDHWKSHPDVVGRTPLMQEEKFHVPYQLPSGRTVWLRGKFDAVDLITTNYRGAKVRGVYLQENKTKGDLDRQQIERQLGFDLQTMLYIVALNRFDRGAASPPNWVIDGTGGAGTEHLNCNGAKVRGVRYNCVRRPLSGGKHTIQQGEGTQGRKCPKCKGGGKFLPKDGIVALTCPKCRGQCRLDAKPAETRDEFYARVGERVKSDPEWFFMRFQVEVTAEDIEKFRRECLDPILEQLCAWWDWIKWSADPFAFNQDMSCNPKHAEAQHFRYPYGVYSPLNEGRVSDLDAYLSTGSTVGLRRVDDLFPELA